jgi:hypothetical protein
MLDIFNCNCNKKNYNIYKKTVINSMVSFTSTVVIYKDYSIIMSVKCPCKFINNLLIKLFYERSDYNR